MSSSNNYSNTMLVVAYLLEEYVIFKSESFTFHFHPVNLTNYSVTAIIFFVYHTVVLFVTAYIKVLNSHMHKTLSNSGQLWKKQVRDIVTTLKIKYNEGNTEQPINFTMNLPNNAKNNINNLTQKLLTRLNILKRHILMCSVVLLLQM